MVRQRKMNTWKKIGHTVACYKMRKEIWFSLYVMMYSYLLSYN